MTQIREREMKCAICGETSAHFVLLSTNSFGYADLDLRPPEMQRSTMNTWVRECPHCGYVSRNLEGETEISMDFLKTERYQTCGGFEFEGKLAERFFKNYLISSESGNIKESFFNLLHCAWVCDDKNDTENAIKIRKLAITYIDKLIAQDDDDKTNYMVMKADLLRRAGMFDEMIEEYKDIIFEEKIMTDIITFQIQKANLKDDGCYTVEDVKKAVEK